MTKPAPTNSPYLTLAEAANYARVSVDTVRRAIYRQELHAAGTAGLFRIKPEWVDEWLENRNRRT
jgi:excisionase family DNA binding protein